MKVLCGTDMIEINRIQQAIDEMGERFTKHIYTPEEITYCESRKKQKYQHYAARFAAKEAIFKAVSDLLKDKYELTWKDVEIRNNKQGKPEIKWIKQKSILNSLESGDISISHCKNYAIAMVTFILSEKQKGGN